MQVVTCDCGIKLRCPDAGGDFRCPQCSKEVAVGPVRSPMAGVSGKTRGVISGLLTAVVLIALANAVWFSIVFHALMGSSEWWLIAGVFTAGLSVFPLVCLYRWMARCLELLDEIKNKTD